MRGFASPRMCVSFPCVALRTPSPAWKVLRLAGFGLGSWGDPGEELFGFLGHDVVEVGFE